MAMETSPSVGWKWLQVVREDLKGWIKQECIAMLKLVLPIFFTTVFTQIIFLISLVFMGQISGGVLEIDAAGLAVALINVTAMAIVIGMGTAIDTLCSQAFGLKHYKRLGIILQQGILVIGLSLFPIWALWLNMESLLILLGQDGCIVKLTSEYIIAFGFALPFVMLYVLMSKYLQAQSIILALVVVGFITNALNVVLASIFIYKLELGFTGAVFAMTLSQSAAPLFLLAAMWAWGLHKQTWGGWSWECLVDWWIFTKLAIPGLFMLGFEWWSYEVGIIVVGTINNTQLGIYVIVLNIATNLFMVPLAIGGAVTVRVGNELGAGHPHKAKRVIYIAAIMTVCEVTVLAVVLQALKHTIGRAFTSDEAVIGGVATMMNMLSVFMYADHFQCILGAAIRGSGQQLAGAVTNFISFYIVGQPIGISLALAGGLGAMGHWIGLLCGASLQTCCYLFMLARTDWKHQSLRAMRHAKVDDVRVSFKKERDGEELQEETVAFDSDSGILGPPHEQDKSEEDVQSPPCNAGEETAAVQACDDDGKLDGGPNTVDTEEGPEGAAATTGNKGHDHLRGVTMWRTKTKLVLYRGVFLALGIAILVGGGVSSRFFVAKGNATDCELHNVLTPYINLTPSAVPENYPSTTSNIVSLSATSLDLHAQSTQPLTVSWALAILIILWYSEE